MKLSPAEAVIPPEKLRDYILAVDHPDGRAKATYLAELGYEQSGWRQLESDLRRQHLILEAQPAADSPWGRKYAILGPLTGPNGRAAWIRTIWIVRIGETAARLVTLIPEKTP